MHIFGEERSLQLPVRADAACAVEPGRKAEPGREETFRAIKFNTLRVFWM